MPLRVAFDLDGTVADMYTALHREALKIFGEEVLAKAAYKNPPPAPGRWGRLAPMPVKSEK